MSRGSESESSSSNNELSKLGAPERRDRKREGERETMSFALELERSELSSPSLPTPAPLLSSSLAASFLAHPTSSYISSLALAKSSEPKQKLVS